MNRFEMSKQPPRKRSMSAAELADELPIFNPASAIGRKESSRSAMKYRLIHLIPVVVILCFFILWCFSSPVELKIKDGRTVFMPRTKKPPKESEMTDVDLTVLALESLPEGFLSVSDAPYASLALNQSDVSLMDTHGHNESLTDSHVANASSSVFNELKAPFSVSDEPSDSLLVGHEPSASLSDFHEPSELFSDSHVPNASISSSSDANFLFPVSDESRVLNPGSSNEGLPPSSGEG